MKNIKYIFVLAVLFVAQGAFAQITVSSTVNSSFSADLGLGSRGEQVKALQTLLSKMPNIYPEAYVTGYFGKLTENAVKKLQKENNLDQVGRVGPKTRTLLNSLLISKNTDSVVYEVPMVNVLEASSNSATTGYIFWTTNKLTTSDLWYGTNSPLDTAVAAKVSDLSKSFSHSHNLSGLATSTTYYYIVKVTDERGNSATTTEKSFKTSSQ